MINNHAGVCLRCNDSRDEGYPFQLARNMVAGSDGRIVVFTTTVGAPTSQDGDGDECATKAYIEYDTQKGEECNSSQEACEDQSERCVDNSST